MLESGNKNKHEFFNVGAGEGETVLQILKTFEKATGINLNYKIIGRRPGDIEKVYADTSNSNERLRWKAE